MHLKRVLALLLPIVPYLYDTIDTGRGDLEAGVEPRCFDQGLGVPLQGRQALASADIPHLAHLVARGRNQQLLSRGELDVPDAAPVPFEGLLECQRTRLPDIYRLVLRARGNQLVVRCDSHSIDILLVSHDCHLSGIHHLLHCATCEFARNAPDFESVILADGGEEIVLLRGKADSRNVLVVALEGRETLNSLLEWSCCIERPELDSVVLGTTEE